MAQTILDELQRQREWPGGESSLLTKFDAILLVGGVFQCLICLFGDINRISFLLALFIF